jgi:hypothetical protein
MIVSDSRGDCFLNRTREASYRGRNRVVAFWQHKETNQVFAGKTIDIKDDSIDSTLQKVLTEFFLQDLFSMEGLAPRVHALVIEAHVDRIARLTVCVLYLSLSFLSLSLKNFSLSLSLFSCMINKCFTLQIVSPSFGVLLLLLEG